MPAKRNFTIGKFLGKSELRYRRGKETIMATNPLVVTDLDPASDFKRYMVSFIVSNDVIPYRRGLRVLATANNMAKRLAKKHGWRMNLLR